MPYEFTIVASGLDPEAQNFAGRFFEAGCDDATVSFQRGAILLDFCREADTLGDAIACAVADVEKAGATVVHVEPDHLVNLSDIAARSGITRAAASLYAKGERGRDFPAPAARATTDSPLWDWAEVAQWFHRQGRITDEALTQARIVRNVNVAIASRREKRTRRRAG